MKNFKTESKRVLDLMVNSIYTHKEIFLRELISNCSDAIDKLYYKSLQENIGLSRADFDIKIKSDKEKRTLTISDNGIGMTAEELENNLGTIAKSGSLAFKSTQEKKEDIDIIGQFGVGFYSVFMVADKVEVVSKAYGEEKANMWVSSGTEGYEIKNAVKPEDTHELETLKNLLQKLEIKESRAREAYMDGIDTKEEYRQNKILLQNERKSLESSIAQFTKIYENSAVQKADRTKQILENIRNVIDILKSDTFSMVQKNIALKSIVDKIIFDREHMHIDIHYYLNEIS